MSKCKYRRADSGDLYTPDCCENDECMDLNWGYVDDDDAEDWRYCPYCGKKIKLVEDE